MKKRVLFVATVLRGHVLAFNIPYMRWFRERGYQVDLCARNDTGTPVDCTSFCDRYFDLPIERSPFSAHNIDNHRRLKRLIDEGDYALISCSTPVGGMLTRLCARDARRRGTRVIYTAHGFHFFSGAPLINWLLYYPAERILSNITDLLITINREDYARALRFHARKTVMVDGVGVDLPRFSAPVDRASVRAGLGIAPDAPVVIVVGEHIPRKNHETALHAVSALENAVLLFCGVGEKEEALKTLALKLGMGERARFLGFRRDVPALLAASDVFCFPSLQEGLPMSLMEAMAAGLPCVVSDVRGNADLIRPGEGGFLRAPRDWRGFAEDIGRLLRDPGLRSEMGERNRRAVRPYGLDQTLKAMAALYLEQLGDD